MWYSASLLLFSEHVDHPSVEPLWEDKIVLVEAEGVEFAKVKAEAIGRAEEHEYRAENDHLVRWRFDRVERVCQIDSESLRDGIELFSRFLKDSEVRSMLQAFGDQPTAP